MAVLLELLAKLVNREHDAATEVGLVEESGELINRELPEGLFNKLFGRAGIVVPLASVKILHPRRRNRHCIRTVPVLKDGRVVIQKFAVLASLHLCLTADGIA